MRNNNRPMPSFWSRLKVIDRSLMLTGIQKKDNGIKMICRAELTDMTTKRATIHILVHFAGNCYFVVFLISANSFKVDTPVRKTTLQVRHNLVGWTIFKSAIQSLVCLLLQATPCNSESSSLALFVRPERCPGRVRRGPVKLILCWDLHQSSLAAQGKCKQNPQVVIIIIIIINLYSAFYIIYSTLMIKSLLTSITRSSLVYRLMTIIASAEKKM